jgi:hypothetical protein
LLQTGAVKNIVAQYQAGIIAANKIFANDKSLRQTFGFGLFGISEF